MQYPWSFRRDPLCSRWESLSNNMLLSQAQRRASPPVHLNRQATPILGTTSPLVEKKEHWKSGRNPHPRERHAGQDRNASGTNWTTEESEARCRTESSKNQRVKFIQTRTRRYISSTQSTKSYTRHTKKDTGVRMPANAHLWTHPQAKSAMSADQTLRTFLATERKAVRIDAQGLPSLQPCFKA